MTKLPTAVIIIPTYNELGNIKKTIDALQAVFKQINKWRMSILVVDDNSPDRTADLIKKLQKNQPNLHLLINQKKAGLGAAYLKGMKKAFDELGADLIFEFDADLSHDPSKIPAFLNKAEEGNDLVLGSRYMPGGAIPVNWGLHRKFLSVVGNLVIRSMMLNFIITDWTTGYRAINKKLYQAVAPAMNDERFSGYTFQVAFLIKAIEKKFKIGQVPFKFVDRTIGKSKMGPEYIKNTLIFLIKIRWEQLIRNRIFKFAVVGVIGAMVQLLTLQIWRLFFPFQLAFFFSVECAVISNFIWSNFWTFADRKLQLIQYPSKFIQFNLASAGSILIQQVIALIGEVTIGLKPLLTLPIINFVFDTGTLYAVLGILIGMFWNFFAYNRLIWKKKKT